MSPHDSKIFPHIAAGTRMTILDVAGLTVEFLTVPHDASRDLCVMRGMIPPGAVVAIHSYGHRLGAPQENAAAGIRIPG
jgi:hypothetical protein